MITHHFIERLARTPRILLAGLAIFVAGTTQAAMVDVGVARDTQVVEGYSTTNYGTGTNMYVASANGGTFKNERVWTSFDLTKQLPPNSSRAALQE